MSLGVGLFCEDSAHESCARALVHRIAREAAVEATIRTGTATAGVGRLKHELRGFQAMVANRGGVPDVLVVLIDANAVGPRGRLDEVNGLLDRSVFPEVVVGTPDPCIERWLLADPVSFAERFGVQPSLRPVRERPGWKARLVDTLEQADEIVVQGGAEFAEEIFGVMDFYRAGNADPTIRTFTDELRRALRRLRPR